MIRVTPSGTAEGYRDGHAGYLLPLTKPAIERFIYAADLSPDSDFECSGLPAYLARRLSEQRPNIHMRRRS